MAKSKTKKHVTINLTDDEHRRLQALAKVDMRPISSEVMYLVKRRENELRR